MTLVVVAAMLCAVAADWLLQRAARFVRPAVLGAAVFAALAAAQGRMLADALRNGPTWYADYGLTGCSGAPGRCSTPCGATGSAIPGRGF